MTTEQIESYLRLRGFTMVTDYPRPLMYCSRVAGMSWVGVDNDVTTLTRHPPGETMWHGIGRRVLGCVYFIENPVARTAFLYVVAQMERKGWRLVSYRDLKTAMSTRPVMTFTVGLSDLTNNHWLSYQISGTERRFLADEDWAELLWFVQSHAVSSTHKKSSHAKPLPLP